MGWEGAWGSSQPRRQRECRTAARLPCLPAGRLGIGACFGRQVHTLLAASGQATGGSTHQGQGLQEVVGLVRAQLGDGLRGKMGREVVGSDGSRGVQATPCMRQGMRQVAGTVGKQKLSGLLFVAAPATTSRALPAPVQLDKATQGKAVQD